MTADGFKIDGAHFTVDGGHDQRVAVAMNPTPLPLTHAALQVFNDNAPVDGTYEVDAEQGLAGFTAHLTDVFGDGQHRLLRQPAVHRLPAPERATAPARSLFDADNQPDRRRRALDRHVHQRRRRATS